MTTYKLNIDQRTEQVMSVCKDDNYGIPFDSGNTDYQEFLDCINEDVNSLFITLYSKMDLIDFSKCKNIKELYIRSINLNEISILGNFNFNRLETLFMSNINILGYDNNIFRNIKYLELENEFDIFRHANEL